jgi:hypothetical protein
MGRHGGGALRNGSEVESQKSCIHPGVSEPALARLVLRCSPLLSRQEKREETGENGHKKGCKNGYENGDRLHAGLLRRVYTFQARVLAS